MIFDAYSLSVLFIALSVDVILGLRMICQTRRLGSLQVQRLNFSSTLTQTSVDTSSLPRQLR
jgi:hypothetical protein